MPSRWKHDRPLSRGEFVARYPDDAACAAHLAAQRWPDGFVCPGCDGRKAWQLSTKPHTWECAGCRRQTSVTAGTVMHGSKLGLLTWFTAIHAVTSHSNGISALQLQAQLGLGSYKSAWLLLHKLRRAMVDPERQCLAGIVEVDETTISYRTKDDPIASNPGRSHAGKLPLIGAVELSADGKPRRIRLERIADYKAATLTAFVGQNIDGSAMVITDGWAGYQRLEQPHTAKIVGTMAAHVVLAWTHRVFANLKRWGLGIFHGFREAHLARYLDEFVFRWNRRRHTAAAFDSLLRIGVSIAPATYRDLVDQRA